MIFKGLAKKYKRILAFVLAAALFFNAWVDYDFSVFAEGEQLEVELKSVEAEYTGEKINPAINKVYVAGDESNEISDSDYEVKWAKDKDGDGVVDADEEVDEIKDAGTYILTVTAEVTVKSETEKPEDEKTETEEPKDEKSETEKSEDENTKTGESEEEKTETGETETSGTETEGTETGETKTLTGTATFVVTPINLEDCEIQVVGSFKAVYNGSAIQPTEDQIILVRNGNEIAKDNYTLGFTSATNARDTITVTATANEGNVNHVGSKSMGIEIEPLKFSVENENIKIEKLEEKYTYTGVAITPEITVTDKVGNEWVNGTDYTVSYENNTDLSDTKSGKIATVKITGTQMGENSKNYTGDTIVKSFEIVPLEGLSDITVSGTQNEGYTGSEWYTGEVTLTAPEGCTIGTDVSEKGNWENTLVISTSGEVKYYLKDADGYITKGETITINIDGTAPVIKDETVSDADEWSKTKTIFASISDENLSEVYYTFDNSESKNELTVNEGKISFEITDEIGETGKVVKVVAVDKAGNASSKDVEVNKIDRTVPKFDENVLIKEWTNKGTEAEPFTFSMGMSDEGSGLDTIELKEPVENVTVIIDQEKGEATITGMPEGINQYTFEATDMAGNSLEQTFTIKVDRTAPSVGVDTENLGGYKKEKVYWFANANVNIPLKFKDEGAENKSGYRVEYSDNADFNGCLTADLTQEKVNVTLSKEKTTYYFRAIDDAGNMSDVQHVTLGYDDSAPEIFLVKVEGINEEDNDNWVNSSEAEEGVQFTVKAVDEQTGVSKLHYSLDNGENYIDVENPDIGENGYTFAIKIPEGTYENKLKIKAVNNVEVFAEDVVAEFTGVDTTAPEEQAYIHFTSDSIGDNVGGKQNEDGTWSSILDAVTNAWDKIWGKEKITFEVYVKDYISGIEAIEMKYIGDNEEITPVLKKEEGIQAFISEEGVADEESVTDEKLRNDGYTVYSGEITTKKNTVAISDFEITSITDIAGNQSKNIKLGEADDLGLKLIYLDNVAPVLELSVKNSDWNVGNDGSYFTKKEEVSVVLTMDERFFEEKGEDNYPTVVLTANGEKVEEQSNNDNWTKVQGENYKWQKEIKLARVSGKEIEYQISVEKYADPSGNLMTGGEKYVDSLGKGNLLENEKAKVVNEEGVFVSNTFVVDDVAPTLKYSTEGDKCSVEEKLVFDTENGLTVNVEIGDQYFDEDNLTVKLIKKDNSEETLTQESGENDKEDDSGEVLTKISSENGKLVYQYNDKSGEYEVKVSYTDKAGNSLSPNAENSLEEGQSIAADGTYTSKEYVIDHKAPEFAVTSYGNPVKVVNDEYETADVPQVGYTAYYAEDIELQFTLEEEYTNYKDNELEHYELKVLKKNDNGEFSTSNVEENDWEVTWENEDGTDSYVATVKIKADKDKHSTDGIYKVEFTSQDCAGNSMAAKESDDSDDISVNGLIDENSVYTSPELVLDTTAPSSDILVQFISDCVGDNKVENTVEEGNEGITSKEEWTSPILSMSDLNWGTIWGREEIQFKVYVNDTLSGIRKIGDEQNIKISYDATADDIENGIEIKNENLSVTKETVYNKEYTVYTGKITCEKGKEIAIKKGNFKVDFVKDIAGNTTENISLNGEVYLDHIAPVFGAGLKEVYWINNEFTVDLDVKDDDKEKYTADSGVAYPIEVLIKEAVSIKEEVSIEEEMTKKPKEDNNVIFSGKNAGKVTYTFKAKDKVGNEVEKTFTVVTDTLNPQLSIVRDKIDGVDKYDQGDVIWFSAPEITIPVSVIDEPQVTDVETTPYWVEYSTDGFETEGICIKEGSTQGSADFELTPALAADQVITYSFRVVDEAGYESEAQSIKVGYDKSAPEISSVTVEGIDKENSDKWVNSSEAKDGVQFTVEVADNQTGISGLQYSLNNGENYIDVENPDIDGNTYTFALEIPEKRHNLVIQAVNNVQVSAQKEITEFTGVDITEPEELAYIHFTSDSIGDNVGGTSNEENGIWSSIWSKVTDTWNKIWGREKITFEVYVKDNLSGIEAIEMKYIGDNKEITPDLKLVEGIQAFISGEGVADEESVTDETLRAGGYIVYSGEITTQKETVAISDFGITSITDVAGNQRENIKLGGAEDLTLVYLDSVKPKLDIKVTDGDWKNLSDENAIDYTNENVSVELTVDERFFAEMGEDGYPTVVLKAKNANEEEFKTYQSYDDWTKVTDTGYKWKKEIELSVEAGKEIEYKLFVGSIDSDGSIQQYADPSGNIMDGTGVSDGIFESGTIVVDGVAPTLTYTVSGEPKCTIGESTVYENTDGNDLEVTVVIEDTQEYFDPSKLSVKRIDAKSGEILKDEEGKEIGEFTLGTCDTEEKEHIYKFNCEDGITDDNVDREFYLQVSYTDRAGNNLTAEKENIETNGKITDGTYSSEQYVIDHVAPKFSLKYNGARIINENWEEVKDITQPIKGCVAYFNDGIEVTFEIDDQYTKLSENGFMEHHILKVTKKDPYTGEEEDVYSSIVGIENETGEDVAIDNQNDITVSWKEDENSKGTYTAEVIILKGEGHVNDGEYQIVFANEDCAGNKMVVAEENDITVDGFDKETGIYKSPTLILDTKAPSTDAFVRFKSDVKGDNQSTVEDFKDSTKEKFLPMKEANTVEIWGQNEIEFEVYVYDDYSGVKEINKGDSITMSYCVNSEPGDPVTLEECKDENTGNTKKQEINGRYYTVYKGTITNKDNTELVITNFQIDKIWDVAGNVTENSTKNSTEKPMTLGGTIYMDNVTPKLEVKYSDAYQLINMSKDGWPTVEDKGNKVTTPQKGYTAFYDSDIVVTLTVSENITKATTGNALEHHELVIKKEGMDVYTSKVGMNNEANSADEENAANGITVEWTKSGDNHKDETYEAKITISAGQTEYSTDGDYQITFASKDCTGNLMEAKNVEDVTVKGLISEGIYTSPVLVLDTTAPIVEVAYPDKDNAEMIGTFKDKDGKQRDYFNEAIHLNITVTDRNIRYSELTSELSEAKAFDIEGKDLNGKKEGIIEQIDNYKFVQHLKGAEPAKSDEFTLALTPDANYTIPIDFEDLAGNEAIIKVGEKEYTDVYKEYVTVDKTPPTFTYKVVGALDDQGENNDGSIGVNYDRRGTFTDMLEKFLGFFFETKGMEIEVKVTDNISGVHSFEYSSPEHSGMSRRTISNKRPSKEFSGTVSIGTMKGQVVVTTADYSSNNSSQKLGAFIVETQTGEIIFDDTATPASREEGNEKYYNQDINMKVTFSEKDGGEAGIDELEVKYDDTTAATKKYKGEGGQITYELTTNEPITTKSFNKNNIVVSASMTDNSGNVSEKEHTTIYNIDVTAPTIKVTYDNNEPYNENHYNKPRVATVEITERNFDENDVVWLITSTDGPEPIIGSWSHSGEDDDSNVHTCTVTFEEDSDYTFSLEFTDMAGNKADYSEVDEFTIDKTLPVMEVTYNNNEYLNEYYYNASRTATIDILEHNFNPDGIQINVTADNATGGASISGWTRNGDHNIATVTFANDAEYTLDIEGVDLANNELEDYEQDHFVVDQTAPELEIYDIENMSANKGEVRPAIRYYDTNYDAEGTVVIFKGYHNGEQEMDGDKTLQANGLELKLYDIPHVQENDDVYTMEATVYDLAGNSSEATVMFSVNRFGSVYTFDEVTKALVGEGGKYYTNEEQDIVIVETNVDTLEFKEITCNLNGKLSTLKEGEDFEVYLDGTEATWKQYTYRIFKENFLEEGTYIITTYSEDKATNTSDNNSKGKSVEFVVDKTSPSVLISGVEDGGQYREDKHEMTLDIEDNIRVAEMIVDINGVETRFNTAQINEMDGKITMDIESDNQWQVIKVTVKDAAGNVTVADELRVLVTANLFVQFVSNQVLLYSTVGVVGSGAVAAWWFIFRKRKITGAS